MSECIFCKIINGEFNTDFVCENEYAVVFRDINPKADTHLLVVPRKHVESLNELDDEFLLGKLMMTVKEAAKAAGLAHCRTAFKFRALLQPSAGAAGFRLCRALFC